MRQSELNYSKESEGNLLNKRKPHSSFSLTESGFNAIKKDTKEEASAENTNIKLEGKLFPNKKKSNTTWNNDFDEAKKRAINETTSSYKTEVFSIVNHLGTALNQNDIKKLEMNFNLFICNSSEKSNRIILCEAIDECRNLEKTQKEKMEPFWNSLVKEFVIQNDFLSFEFIVDLLKMHIKFNQAIYFPGGKFNIELFNDKVFSFSIYEKEKFLSESLVIKILRDMNKIKDASFKAMKKALYLLSKGYKEKTNEIFSYFTHELIKKTIENVWNSFENLLNCASSRYEEYETVLESFNKFYEIVPYEFDSQFIKRIFFFYELNETKIEAYNYELNKIQSQSKQTNELLHTKVIFESLYVKWLLNHPFTERSWDNELKKYILQNQCSMLEPFKIFLEAKSSKSLKGAHWELLLKRYLEVNEIELVYKRNNNFICESLCSVIESNANNFWSNLMENKSIINYLRYLNEEQNIECLLKLMVSTMTPHPDSYESNVAKAMRFFPSKILQVKENILEDEIKSSISTNYFLNVEVAEALLKAISYEPKYFFTNYPKECEILLTKMLKKVLNSEELFLRCIENLLSTMNAVLDDEWTTKYGEKVIKEIHPRADWAMFSSLKQMETGSALLHHLLILLKHSLNNNDWFFTLFKWCKEHSTRIYDEYYGLYVDMVIGFLQHNLEADRKEDLRKCEIESIFEYLEWSLDINFEVPWVRVNKLGLNSKQEDNPTERLKTRNFTKEGITKKALAFSLREALHRSVLLLKNLCLCYLAEEKSGKYDILPEGVRAHLLLPNKDGAFQLQLSGHKATSFVVGIACILFVPGFFFDEELIFETMELLSKVSKSDMNIYEYFSGKSIVKLHSSILDTLTIYIRQKPSASALEYIVKSNQINLFAKEMQREVANELMDSGENLKAISCYLMILAQQKPTWEEINEKMAFIEKEISDRTSSLLEEEEKKEREKEIQQIYENLGIFVLNLQVQDESLYCELIIKYFSFFLNAQHILSALHTSFYKATQLLLSCRCFLKSSHFESLRRIALLPTTLQVLIDNCIASPPNKYEQSLVFGVLLNSLQLLLHLASNTNTYKNYFASLHKILSKKNASHHQYFYEESLESLNETLTNTLLKSLCDKQVESISHEAQNWVFELASLIPKEETTLKVVKTLKKLSSKVEKAYAYQYICKASAHCDFSPETWKTLCVAFDHSIFEKRHYEIVWNCEILIQMCGVKQVSSSTLSRIETVLSQSSVLNRMAELLLKLSRRHGLEFHTWFGVTLPLSYQNLSNFALSDFIELLAWFRVLNIYVDSVENKNEFVQLKNATKEMLLLMTRVLEEKTNLTCDSPIEIKLEKTQLEDLLSEFNEFNPRAKNGLELMAEVMSWELAQSVAMLFVRLHDNEKLSKEIEQIFRFCSSILYALNSAAKPEMEALLKAFGEQIYFNSVQLTEELLFTNCKGLTSGLVFTDVREALTETLGLLLEHCKKSLSFMEYDLNKGVLFSTYKKKYNSLITQIQKTNLETDALSLFSLDHKQYLSENTLLMTTKIH